jgi:hypothetical protein
MAKPDPKVIAERKKTPTGIPTAHAATQRHRNLRSKLSGRRWSMADENKLMSGKPHRPNGASMFYDAFHPLRFSGHNLGRSPDSSISFAATSRLIDV